MVHIYGMDSEKTTLERMEGEVAKMCKRLSAGRDPRICVKSVSKIIVAQTIEAKFQIPDNMKTIS